MTVAARPIGTCGLVVGRLPLDGLQAEAGEEKKPSSPAAKLPRSQATLFAILAVWWGYSSTLSVVRRAVGLWARVLGQLQFLCHNLVGTAKDQHTVHWNTA